MNRDDKTTLPDTARTALARISSDKLLLTICRWRDTQASVGFAVKREVVGRYLTKNPSIPQVHLLVVLSYESTTIEEDQDSYGDHFRACNTCAWVTHLHLRPQTVKQSKATKKIVYHFPRLTVCCSKEHSYI